jgi:hypothetical protein
LNFLARVIPDALCGPCGLRETDTFMARVYPRNEFGPNHPVLDKPAGWLLPPMRLGIEGQSSHFTRLPGFHASNCKAQTFFLAAPSRVAWGLTQN